MLKQVLMNEKGKKIMHLYAKCYYIIFEMMEILCFPVTGLDLEGTPLLKYDEHRKKLHKFTYIHINKISILYTVKLYNLYLLIILH